MACHPRRFSLSEDDLEFRPTNLTNAEVEKRFKRVVGDGAQNIPANPYAAIGVQYMDAIVHKMAKAIQLPSLCPALFNPPGGKSMKPPRGFLLHGSAGTGKTSIAMAVKQECSRFANRKVSFFETPLAVILDGNPDNNLYKLFNAAKRLQPSLIFLDEVDRLLISTNSFDSLERNLMTLMDGSVALPSVYVLACTNKLDAVCSELKRSGRFEVKFLLRLPQPDERTILLNVITAGWQIARTHLNTIALSTENFSPADLAAVCCNAKQIAFDRRNACMKSPDSTTWTALHAAVDVTAEDLDTALSEFKDARR